MTFHDASFVMDWRPLVDSLAPQPAALMAGQEEKMNPTTRLVLGLALLVSAFSDAVPALASPDDRSLTAPAALSLNPTPDQTVDGFPIWIGSDGEIDRVVVLVEGFDLYNAMTAADLLRLVAPAAQRILANGLDILVVDFADSHLPPDALAPTVARAVLAASAAAQGAQVAVVGLSGGGIAARWALVSAESAGAPLPVHTLVLFDCPNRGARLHPALQALTLRYGSKRDRAAISCGAALALIEETPGKVIWARIGAPIPEGRRRVPARVTADGRHCAQFFKRLQSLNNRRGYPARSRVVAVAQGSRRTSAGERDLYYMWLPFGKDWTLKMDEADRAPGSLLPKLIVERFRIRMPLGLAGAYLRSVPTFIATESALDSSPDENPPFDEWYARADDLPPIAHDGVDPGAVDFVTRVLVAARWEPPH